MAHQILGPEGELPKEITDALAAGEKIVAIKLYREATGVGLKESKDAIEEYERRGFVSSPPPGHDASNDKEIPAGVEQALRANRKIEAVKLYRAARGCGLKDAKAAVDIIEGQLQGHTAKSGCMSVLLLIAAPGASVWFTVL